jgi:hypothetical protein
MSKAIPYKNVADTLLKLPRKITAGYFMRYLESMCENIE